MGLNVRHFGIDFSLLSHQLLYYCVLFLEKSTEGLRSSHIEDDLLIAGCASLLKLDDLFFKSLDLFAKFINALGLFCFGLVFFVRLFACRESEAMIFDDSIVLYIFFVELLLKAYIFMSILLIFVDYLLSMVEIVLKLFILVF